MSVIWSGVTEEGAVVPVQVDETGKVIATAAVPGGDYVKKTGDNMTGDLTLGAEGSPVITLNASNGIAAFDGSVRAGDPTFSGPGVVVSYTGNIYIQPADNSDETIAFSVVNSGDFKEPVSQITAGGSAAFAGNGTFAGPVTVGAINLSDANGIGSEVSAAGLLYVQKPSGSPDNALEIYQGTNPTVEISAVGSATFADGKCGFTSSGELYFTSRGARYKAVVQDQLVIAEPYTRQMELKEKAEQFIADKRETKPSDPQSGVTMDIDNSSPKRD